MMDLPDALQAIDRLARELAVLTARVAALEAMLKPTEVVAVDWALEIGERYRESALNELAAIAQENDMGYPK